MDQNAPESIEKELAEVNQQIQMLERYKTALEQVITVRRELESGKGRAYVPQPVTLTNITEGEELPDARPNSVEMARTVLYNLGGEEKTPDEIRELILKTYGVKAAKSLDQMLYRRAAQGKTFYKTPSGRFGLLSNKPKIEQVRIPATGIA
jgi:hypothetical protein